MKRTTKSNYRKFLRVYLPGPVAIALGWAKPEICCNDDSQKTLLPTEDTGSNSRQAREALEGLPENPECVAFGTGEHGDIGAGFKTTLSVYPRHLRTIRRAMRQMGVSASQVITTALILRHQTTK